MNRAAPQRRRTARRGFTILEMLLALMLGTIVIVGAGSMTLLLTASGSRLERRLDSTTNLGVVHAVLRRATSYMVPAPNPQGSTVPAPADGGGDPDAVRALLSELGLEGSIPAQASVIDEPLRFELSRIPTVSGRAMPHLILTLARPPVFEDQGPDDETLARADARTRALLTAEAPVRGVIEFADDLDALARAGQGGLNPAEVGMVMQWRGIDPPTEPVVLLRGVIYAEFFALPPPPPTAQNVPEESWTQIYAAHFEGQFPLATRVVVWTQDGMQADWLFETVLDYGRPRSP